MKGKLIIIDGSDGSGKETQSNKLYDRLKKEGLNVKRIEFPDYNSKSSALIKMYLNGEFGSDPSEVNAYVASSFYAVDRYASFKTKWKDFYLNGGIIIADRYTTSNMVHQAAKIEDKAERNTYLQWLCNFEFELFGLPVPDMVVFLKVPPEYSYKLIEDRANKYTGEQSKDIHERNLVYLKSSYNNAIEIAEEYKWAIIDCIENNQMRSIDKIHECIYDKIKVVINK